MDHAILRSGNLQVDMQCKSVLLSGNALSLTPTSFDLLCYLLQKSPEVISVDELLEQIWKGKVVSRETVKQQVKTLRQQLQSASHQIESVRGFGYRFNHVESLPENEVSIDTAPPANSVPRFSFKNGAFVGLVAFFIVIALFTYLSNERKTTKVSLPLVVAILPFEQFQTSSLKENFPRILQDQLTTELSKQKDVRTLSLSSLDASVAEGLTPQQYFEHYKVDMLIEGSVRPVTSGFNVNIRVVWTQSGITVWRQTLAVSSDEQEYLLQEVENTLVTFVNKKVVWIGRRNKNS